MSPTAFPFNDAITLVPDLGVLHCSGADARTFLHGQLSNDIALQQPQQARLAAYLNAKGRMLANLIALRDGDEDVLLLCHQSILPAVQKRLGMFVLRAKVHITDASDQWQLRGLLGQAVERVLGQPLQSWQVLAWRDAAQSDTNGPAARAVGLYPADGAARALLLVPAGQTAPAATLDDLVWASSEVRSGVATISAPVVEQFVPQMLNYESVGGISFKKGCYPGQEVVARSQFRGAIKRRAFLVRGQSLPVPAPGTEIHAAGSDQPCGVLVQSAAAIDGPAGAFDAVASLRVDAAQAPLELRLDQITVPLTVSPAPYPLLEDI